MLSAISIRIAIDAAAASCRSRTAISRTTALMCTRSRTVRACASRHGGDEHRPKMLVQFVW
jgi:hypothetical protein